jgi:hypothetical protein
MSPMRVSCELGIPGRLIEKCCRLSSVHTRSVRLCTSRDANGVNGSPRVLPVPVCIMSCQASATFILTIQIFAWEDLGNVGAISRQAMMSWKRDKTPSYIAWLPNMVPVNLPLSGN